MLALAARMNLDGGLVPRALAARPPTAGLEHRCPRTADAG